MKRVRFEDIVTRVNTKEDRFNTDKIYYVGGEHIESNDIKVHQRGIIKGSTIGPMFYCGFKAGDVLFVTRNPHLRKCAVVDFDGICSEKTFVLGTKDSSRLLQEYLPLIMQSDDFWAYCEENKSGGVNFFVNWSTLANYEFDLPSLEEQRVLADKLWAAYEVKESYKNLLAQTDKLLHAQFEKMFGEEESNGIVGNIATVVSGQSIPAMLEDEKGDYPYVKVADFNIEGNERRISTSSHLITSENAEQSRIIPIGTIVFAKNGAASLSNKKRVTNVECCIDMNVIGVIPSEKVIPDFLLAFFESINISDYVRQGAIPSIAPKDVENIGLFIPSMEKQLEFVRIAEQAERTKASLNKGIEAIEAVIRSLIAESTTKV